MYHSRSRGNQDHAVLCTAPSAEEYIAELQASLEASGNVTAEMLARMTEQSAVLAEALRERDEFRDKLARAEEDFALMGWCLDDVLNRGVHLTDVDKKTGRRTYTCCGESSDTINGAIRAAMEAVK